MTFDYAYSYLYNYRNIVYVVVVVSSLSGLDGAVATQTHLWFMCIHA